MICQLNCVLSCQEVNLWLPVGLLFPQHTHRDGLVVLALQQEAPLTQVIAPVELQHQGVFLGGQLPLLCKHNTGKYRSHFTLQQITCPDFMTYVTGFAEPWHNISNILVPQGLNLLSVNTEPQIYHSYLMGCDLE